MRRSLLVRGVALGVLFLGVQSAIGMRQNVEQAVELIGQLPGKKDKPAGTSVFREWEEKVLNGVFFEDDYKNMTDMQRLDFINGAYDAFARVAKKYLGIDKRVLRFRGCDETEYVDFTGTFQEILALLRKNEVVVERLWSACFWFAQRKQAFDPLWVAQFQDEEDGPSTLQMALRRAKRWAEKGKIPLAHPDEFFTKVGESIAASHQLSADACSRPTNPQSIAGKGTCCGAIAQAVLATRGFGPFVRACIVHAYADYLNEGGESIYEEMTNEERAKAILYLFSLVEANRNEKEDEDAVLAALEVFGSRFREMATIEIESADYLEGRKTPERVQKLEKGTFRISGDSDLAKEIRYIWYELEPEPDENNGYKKMWHYERRSYPLLLCIEIQHAAQSESEEGILGGNGHYGDDVEIEKETYRCRSIVYRNDAPVKTFFTLAHYGSQWYYVDGQDIKKVRDAGTDGLEEDKNPSSSNDFRKAVPVFMIFEKMREDEQAPEEKEQSEKEEEEEEEEEGELPEEDTKDFGKNSGGEEELADLEDE